MAQINFLKIVLEKSNVGIVISLYCNVFIIAFIAAVVAVAIAFMLIAGLHSDLTAAMKDSSSSPGSTSETV